MRFLALVALFALSVLLAHAQSGSAVDLKRLLPEMLDMRRLAKRPSPSYTQAQASSYDRNAKEPGSEAWFANGDAGKFLGEDRKEGRIERIMAVLQGPGVVNRIWSANPVGIIRFYFDGESEARFAWNLPDLLSGKIRPFVDPFGYVASKGWNLYFPIPYAKSLKITVDDTKGDAVRGLYYHVGYRAYAPTTAVRSLTAEDLESHKDLIEQTAAKISMPRTMPANPTVAATIAPLQFTESIVDRNGAGAITYLSLRFEHHEPVPGLPEMEWDNPIQLNHALRKIRLVADFDGERCIDVPVSDFFASSAGTVPFETMAISVKPDGTMVSRFVMPYSKSARIQLVPMGGPLLKVQVMAKIEPFDFDDQTYHFRAQYLNTNLFSRPMRDMEFLKAQGEGVYVGSSLHIGNPVPAWWGEGDEKVFVDGEKFPSTFGTGTEDYFGYAWSNPELFVRPYHAQPRCDGPGTRGHIQNIRWHLFDPIPFRNELAFYIELWHWAEVQVDFDRVAYWYSKPGGTPPRSIESLKDLVLNAYPRPAPVKGAVEGEKARIVSKTGGVTEIQEFGELSAGNQLWWRDMNPCDKLVLEVPVAEEGLYEVTGNFCHARDYGIHRLTLGGTVLSESTDFYSPNLKWQVLNLGKVRLKGGVNQLVVDCVGKNPAAEAHHMFGLDYVLLKRVG